MAPKSFTLALCLTLALPAWAEVDVTQIGIQSAAEITDPGLRALRMKMVGGTPLTYKELRALADAGDGLAAFKTAQTLEAEDDTALVDDAIHYYAVAARTGRDFAVRRLVSLLRTYEPDLQPALQRNAEDALRTQAQNGNVIAAQALSDMYLQGKPFGKNTERGLAYLEMSAGQGDGKAAVRLAMMYLKGTDDVPADRDLARATLKIAAQSTDLGSRTMAENLLRMMPEPPRRRPDNMVVQPVALTDVTPTLTPRPDVVAPALTDEAPQTIKPRPRPAGIAARVAASLENDLRRTAPPRRPADLEQAALQTGTSP
jgi:hypothetical protein